MEVARPLRFGMTKCKSRARCALLLSSQAQARDLTYPIVARKIAWTTIHAFKVPTVFAVRDDKMGESGA